MILELRSTVEPEFLSEDDINWMIDDLDKRGYQGTYWLQHVVTSGEKTLGNIASPSRAYDKSLLHTPKGFALGFRNFPN